MDWLISNKEWLFSGVGVFLLGLLATSKKIYSSSNNKELEKNKTESTSHNNFAINISNSEDKIDSENIPLLPTSSKMSLSLEEYKDRVRILFIDDDTRFKVVKILKRSGWVHTNLIKDCDTLDDVDVEKADILFIDVQGVGISMGFSDEGLGLALAIKEKYKEKKVIIYSAETEGDRFHLALRKADSFLAKNADPYQFQKIVEEFTIGIDQ